MTPEYLVRLPRDPRNASHPEQQYLYQTDGQEHRIIRRGAEDAELVCRIRPGLIDPARASWAYSLVTEAAAQW